MSDQAARRRIREDLRSSLVVEASAGTGKTTEIIRRIVAVLESPDTQATVSSIVVVTFAQKAAGELKLRLRGALERGRQEATQPSRREALERALAHLEEARISTIHGFCGDLLAERPVEAGIDPAFRVLPEAEAEQLFSLAFHEWFEARLPDPPPGLRRLLHRGVQTGSISDRLMADGWSLSEWRDYPADWAPRPFDRAAGIAALIAELEALAQVLRANSQDELSYSLRQAVELAEHIRRTEAVRERDIDELEGRLVALVNDYNFRNPRRGRGGFAPGLSRDVVLARYEHLLEGLAVFRDSANSNLAPLLRSELCESLDHYERLKAERGVLDFTDLLVRARDLLCGNATVRREFQQRFTHIFVDEFQDTSAVQAELLLLLAAEDATTTDWRQARPTAGKLFIVGDPKQSIYRFRRADIRAYEDIKARLVAHGVECLALTSSFRSVAGIQRCVNAAFAPLMTGASAHQPQYLRLAEVRPDVPAQPAVVVVPAPHPYGRNDKVAKKAIRESLPDAVAAFVAWLVRESGWTVEEDGRRVAVEPRHVCVLFRQYSDWSADLTRSYVTALEARDIPHVVVGGRRLHGREEVETLRAALRSIEYPDDELSLYATLRGPLFAFSDATLFEYRSVGGLDYTRVPAEVAPHLTELRDALLFLRFLHRTRNRRPVADVLTNLLEHTRAFANFVFRPSGEQVLANVLLLEELAHAYDAAGGLSYRGFVEQLERDANRGQAREAPTLEEWSDGVRMMTVHKAKGLEFPVVVLADFCAPLHHARRSHFVDSERRLVALPLAGCSPNELLMNAAVVQDEDEAEGIRLAYVGATRARDLLVVTALGEERFDEGWLTPLNEAVYPPSDTGPAAPAPSYCSGFGRETTLERPRDVRAASVPPGDYRLGSSEAPHSVVWWDPARLGLGCEPRFGLRQDTLLANDGPADQLAADVAAFEAWRREREARISAGSVATLRIGRVTDTSSGTVGDRGVATLDVPRPDERQPMGARFGTLVHAILAAVPLDASHETILAYAQICSRVLGSSEDDANTAAEVVERALAHPLLRRAAAASRLGKCRRESPVTLVVEDDALVEGVVDLAFEEDGEWNVVDFKTDADPRIESGVYETQVGLYAEAIERATGLPCRGTILRV